MNEIDLIVAATNFLAKWVETFNADKLALPNLYSQHASLHGTSSPELFIGRDRIKTYFHGSATVEMGDFHSAALTDDTVLLVGHCVFRGQREGQAIMTPARFTFVMLSGPQGWQVLHHHSSATP